MSKRSDARRAAAEQAAEQQAQAAQQAAEQQAGEQTPEPEQEEGEQEEASEAGSSNLATTMRKYRAGYRAATNASGTKTRICGDALSLALLALSPAATCAAADVVLEQPAGFHAARYAALNPGQQRMNSGNRIRGFLRQNPEMLESALRAIGGNEAAAA